MGETRSTGDIPKTAEPVERFAPMARDSSSPDMGLLSGHPEENLAILKEISKTEKGQVALPSTEVSTREDTGRVPAPVDTAYGAGFERQSLSSDEQMRVGEELAQGRDPLELISQLGKDESLRVIAFGETHFDPPMQAMTVEAIGKLGELGFTHVALEMDSKCQGIIDDYMKSGDEAAMRKALGPVAVTDYWAPRIVAAREAGLKVVAMDKHLEKSRQPFSSKEEADASHKAEAEFDLQRDQIMFDNVDAILAGDPSARVILIGGSGHYGEQSHDPEHPTLGHKLKEKYPDAVATFVSQTDTATVDTLYPFLEGLDAPIIVPTHGADGASTGIDDLRRNQRPLGTRGSGWYRDWDYIAMFPDK